MNAGTTSPYKFYTLNDNVYLLLVYNSNVFISVYPTELNPGENNIVAMYDTTTVYHTTLNSRSVMDVRSIKRTSNVMEFKDIFNK